MYNVLLEILLTPSLFHISPFLPPPSSIPVPLPVSPSPSSSPSPLPHPTTILQVNCSSQQHRRGTVVCIYVLPMEWLVPSILLSRTLHLMVYTHTHTHSHDCVLIAVCREVISSAFTHCVYTCPGPYSFSSQCIHRGENTVRMCMYMCMHAELPW